MIYVFDLRTRNLETKQECSAAEVGRFYVDYIGNVVDGFEDKIKKIRNLAFSYDYGELFHGPFLLLIYDKIRKTAVITMHTYGSPVPVYYLNWNDRVYVSTSLEGIKKETGIPFVLNENKVSSFLMNGCITGESTLLKSVFKLPQGRRLLVGKFGVRLINNRDYYGSQLNKYGGIDERYEGLAEYVIKNNLPKINPNEKYTIALSGGFDSNYVLHFLKKLYPNKAICATSVGGIHGRDETVVANEIASLYENVKLETTLVTPETFSHIDEIVERLEGNVFEIGVFLQYELAKHLSKNGHTHLICGECADQVFNKQSYIKSRKKYEKLSYEKTPLQMASYVVLKKSAYMLNSFGIKGYYPFLDREMLAFGYSTREQNGCSKELHKAECKRLLMPEIAGKLSKQGGTTQMSALFEDDFNCLKEAEKSKFYDRRYVPSEFGACENEKVYYALLKYLESFENIFCDRS